MTILHPWRDVRPWNRHSLVLIVAGIVYLLIGFSYLTTKDTPARQRALHYALEVMSMRGWGIVFMIAGLLSIFSSRWPPTSEKWGYTVLTALASCWSAFYLVGIWFGHAPKSNYSSVCVWGVIAFLWWAIAGLTNPPRRPRSRE